MNFLSNNYLSYDCVSDLFVLFFRHFCLLFVNCLVLCLKTACLVYVNCLSYFSEDFVLCAEPFSIVCLRTCLSYACERFVLCPLVFILTKVQTHKRFKRALFIRTKPPATQKVIPFIKLQNKH